MSKRVIHAVHDKELKKLLENLGFLKQFEDGNIKCNICGIIINDSNFGCIYSEEGEIKFTCNNLECYKILLRNRGDIL